MIFVDTGFLLAVVRPRDTLHFAAKAWARHLTEPLLTTEYVLVETVNALSRAIDRDKVQAAVEIVFGRR